VQPVTAPILSEQLGHERIGWNRMRPGFTYGD
jgi:hypothetical protein